MCVCVCVCVCVLYIYTNVYSVGYHVYFSVHAESCTVKGDCVLTGCTSGGTLVCDVDGRCTCETDHQCTDGENVRGKHNMIHFPKLFDLDTY